MSDRSSPSAPPSYSSLHQPESTAALPDPSSPYPPYPPYPNDGRGSGYPQWQSSDPRASSSQSLVPSAADDGTKQRRTLLLVYIHGFMGNDTSFRSFPAHVHNYLRFALADTHVIHSKIYPRYKTYKAIEVARDNFSKWLEPHESDTTDVILVGHSMGGLLAADVVLMPAQNRESSPFPFRHRILGSISLDSPFLGLHPGVIVSGIASLFSPAPDPQKPEEAASGSLAANPESYGSISPDPSVYQELSPPSGVTSPSTMSPMMSIEAGPANTDPFFNPPFPNDVPFQDRGWWRNIAHFAAKHKSEGLVGSAAHHITSHLEFGSCLADYPALNVRYSRIRQLEDVDDLKSNEEGPIRLAQVRFVNFYSISTGRPKKPKTPELEPAESAQDKPMPGATPKISPEDHSDSEQSAMLEYIPPIPMEEPEEEPKNSACLDGKTSGPIDNDDGAPAASGTPEKATPDNCGTSETAPVDSQDDDPSLPTIPELPEKPQPPDLSQHTDKEERKQAEKEAKRLQKAYDHAVKEREKAIKERQKQIEKRQKKAQKEAEKKERAEQKAAEKRERENAKRLRKEELALQKEELALQKDAEALAKKQTDEEGKKAKKKERKFCMLPRKNNGQRDEAWVSVFMEGVDEVGAHCGLFFPGPHYESLIGEVGSKIVTWVQDDMSKRAILGLTLD